MRNTRVEKFRQLRHDRIRKVIIFAMFLPCTSIILGYIITALFILSKTKKNNLLYEGKFYADSVKVELFIVDTEQ